MRRIPLLLGAFIASAAPLATAELWGPPGPSSFSVATGASAGTDLHVVVNFARELSADLPTTSLLRLRNADGDLLLNMSYNSAGGVRLQVAPNGSTTGWTVTPAGVPHRLHVIWDGVGFTVSLDERAPASAPALAAGTPVLLESGPASALPRAYNLVRAYNGPYVSGHSLFHDPPTAAGWSNTTSGAGEVEHGAGATGVVAHREPGGLRIAPDPAAGGLAYVAHALAPVRPRYLAEVSVRPDTGFTPPGVRTAAIAALDVDGPTPVPVWSLVLAGHNVGWVLTYEAAGAAPRPVAAGTGHLSALGVSPDVPDDAPLVVEDEGGASPWFNAVRVVVDESAGTLDVLVDGKAVATGLPLPPAAASSDVLASGDVVAGPEAPSADLWLDDLWIQKGLSLTEL